METRYVTLRTKRHLVAVDVLEDKESDSFFEPVLPKRAKLYLAVQGPLIRKSFRFSALFPLSFHPLVSYCLCSARVYGSPPAVYVEYPEMTLAKCQEYYDRMSHNLFSKQDQDYPFSGQLGEQPARNLPVPTPGRGKLFLHY